MAFVSSKEIINKAWQQNYAVPAFNVENMEMAMAVIKSANELNSPVIIQTTSSTIKYATTGIYSALVKSIAKNVEIPVALHLDHGVSYEIVKNAIENGYTSVMIDGSKLPFEENIQVTKKVVEYARYNNVPVEGELGKVGGKEDELESEITESYTDPEEALEFTDKTGVDFLAIAIGTAHGVYKKTPNINIDKVDELKRKLKVPLVLHGTSGIDGEIVKECVKAGICKVNYATELRIAYTDGVKEALELNKEILDPKTYGKNGMKKVEEIVKKNIGYCYSEGKA